MAYYFFTYVARLLIVLGIAFKGRQYIEVTSKRFLIVAGSYTVIYILINKYVDFH